MNILNKFSVNQMILVSATAIGAFGGFPAPPKMFNELVKNEIVQKFIGTTIKSRSSL